jgi:mono/diheme cytochrome c family protein
MEYANVTIPGLMRTTFLLLAMACPIGVAMASSDGPPEKKPADGSAQPVSGDVSGSDTFMQYCALCHGNDGRGIGPLTDVDAMKKSAADLTQIAKRNGGVFPFSKVADTVRDGGGLAGHNPSRMLAWGKIFSAESDPIRAKAIVFEVTRYVESLQEK